MHCRICDGMLPEVQFSETWQDIEPCPTCLMVIADTVGNFVDKPSADEGDLPEEDAIYLLSGFGGLGVSAEEHALF